MAIEWYEEKPDGRIIEKLVDWRRAVEALDNPIHRAFYELLLFTGLRKGEAMTLEWKYIHADRIHLPMTKNGRSFHLPILQVHHDILAPLEGLSSKWVFPSPKSATGHITGTRKLQWSPHAHRRTFATVAMEAGVLEEVVGRLLNHTPLSITGSGTRCLLWTHSDLLWNWYVPSWQNGKAFSFLPACQGSLELAYLVGNSLLKYNRRVTTPLQGSSNPE